MRSLPEYYDCIEPISLALAKKVSRVAQTNPHVVWEAEYILRTAQRIVAHADSYKSTPCSDPGLLADIDPIIQLMELMEESLPALLSGRMSGGEVARKGGLGLWEGFNGGNPVMGSYPTGVAKWAAPLVPGRTVLEIGGGVGATTKRLTEPIKEAQEYVFTDIKPYFLDPIRATLPVETDILDLNNLPDSMGKKFDLILATNSMHVSKDLDYSLRWAFQHLSPEGILILGEGSPYSKALAWPLDLVCGLFEGWWDIPSSFHRPYPGFLLPENWLTLLYKTGFSTVRSDVWGDHARCFGGVYVAGKS